MSQKSDCGKHRSFWGGGVGGGGRRLSSRICACLLFWIVVILFAILVVYLVLHPHKPRFYVQDATVREWNVTNGLLSSEMEFTVVSRNPNDRIGIYYDRISAYASYSGQQITPIYQLTPFYQGHKDVNILTTILYGNAVPLAPFITDRLKYELQNGVVTVNLKIGGRIRWKVGTWTSGRYHLNVNCYTLLGFGSVTPGGVVPLQPGTRCDVNV